MLLKESAGFGVDEEVSGIFERVPGILELIQVLLKGFQG